MSSLDVIQIQQLLHTNRSSAFLVIGAGVAFAALVVAPWLLLPAMWAAGITGILVSALLCLVALIAMPRAMQIGIMGAFIGVSMDGAYAKLSDATPVTMANALVDLARNIAQAIDIINGETEIAAAQATINTGIWAFILSTIVFMLLSFLIRHDG